MPEGLPKNDDVDVLEKNIAVAENVEIGEGVKESLQKFASPDEVLAKEASKQEKKEREAGMISKLRAKIQTMAGRAPEQLIAKGKDRLEKNPRLQAGFNEEVAKYPDRKEKLLKALGKWQYSKWDEKKQDYIDSGVYTDYVNK